MVELFLEISLEFFTLFIEFLWEIVWLQNYFIKISMLYLSIEEGQQKEFILPPED